MPRGRPKGSKNKVKNQIESNIAGKTTELFTENKENSESNVSTLEKNTSKNVSKNTKKIVCFCDQCGAEIYSSAIAVNLSHLTGQASWHRECSLEKLNLCNKCGEELNQLIDNWILKNHPEYRKFLVS